MATIRAVIFREEPRRGRARRLVGRAGLCLALALAVIAGGLRGDARASDASEARRHAQRATSLAASGKCKQAVVEFDRALAILRDPALLFNRGECRRKLGDVDAAIDDYEQFLSDLPGAPNRAEVRTRIADLKRARAATAAAAAPATSDGAGEPAPRATTGRSRAQRPGIQEAALPVLRTRAPATSREVVLTPAPPAAGAESGSDDAPYTGAAIATASDTAPASSSDAGVGSRPWFWIAVAVVAAGAGVGTFVLLNRDGTNVPSSALGNYKF